MSRRGTAVVSAFAAVLALLVASGAVAQTGPPSDLLREYPLGPVAPAPPTAPGARPAADPPRSSDDADVWLALIAISAAAFVFILAALLLLRRRAPRHPLLPGWFRARSGPGATRGPPPWWTATARNRLATGLAVCGVSLLLAWAVVSLPG